MKNRSPPPRIQCCLGKHNKNLWTHTVPQPPATSFPGFSPAGLVVENPGNEVDCAGPKGVRLRESWLYSWFATTWQGGHVGGQYNIIFSWEIYAEIEFSSLPRGEKCFCSWPPTWPPWRHVQASKIGIGGGKIHGFWGRGTLDRNSLPKRVTLRV